MATCFDHDDLLWAERVCITAEEFLHFKLFLVQIFFLLLALTAFCHYWVKFVYDTNTLSHTFLCRVV
jgi:hypothetical protein